MRDRPKWLIPSRLNVRQIAMTNPEWIMAEAPVTKVRKEKERKDHKRDRKNSVAPAEVKQRVQPRRY